MQSRRVSLRKSWRDLRPLVNGDVSGRSQPISSERPEFRQLCRSGSLFLTVLICLGQSKPIKDLSV